MVSLRTIIIGAGPAGLAAGYELTKKNSKVIVLEQSGKVGGRSRYETYNGHTIDLNAAPFTTQLSEVHALWQDLLPTDFITAAGLNRIVYRDRFFDYPLSFTNALKQLGPIDTTVGALSYLRAKTKASFLPTLSHSAGEATAKDWLVERFGLHLYRLFFEPYLTKILGLPPTQLHSDWISQFLEKSTLPEAIKASFSHSSGSTQLFDYPLLGPGMLWERCRTRIEMLGAKVQVHAKVVQIERTGNRIDRVVVQRRRKRRPAAIASSKIAAQEIVLSSVDGDQFVSSLPLAELINQLEPPAPPRVRKAAQQLMYRSIITVVLIVNCERLFPDTTLYVQAPALKVGRIQNYKNWSPAMVPNRQKTCLGLEYFCTQGDALWQLSDEALMSLASKEVGQLGLTLSASQVAGGTVIRQPKVQLLHKRDYHKSLAVVQDYLSTFENLQVVGQAADWKHDYAAFTGLVAARNIITQRESTWETSTLNSVKMEAPLS